MTEKPKEQVVKDIDYMMGRHYDLCHKKEPLTEEEKRELRGWGVKIALLRMGGGLSGMSLKEYLSLTDRAWGDKAKKEIAEGKRQYDNRTEEELAKAALRGGKKK